MLGRMKRFIVSTLMVTSLCTFVTGCGSSDNSNDTTGNTTAEVTTTKTAEVTTAEPTTTEEPSTEYVYKGTLFAISSTYQSIFADVIVEKGYKFNVNDFVDESASDAIRGKFALDLVKALFSKNREKISEFENKYFEAGATTITISYSQNVVIEYDGDEKLCFYLVKDNGKYSYFDVYAID